MGEDLTTEAPEELPESDLPAEGETKPTAVNVIKRGVPKNTKPAPAVVAIKMADLLSVPDEDVDEKNQNDVNAEVASQDNLEKLADEITSQQLLENQREDEK